MQITIRGHHLSITPAIEDTIRCKFAEMTKHIDQVNSMQVKLTKDHQVDKHTKKGSSNHIAEAIIRLPGIEFFAQKKLTQKFFGIFSYTFYRSLYSDAAGKLVASSWDNRHLLSITWGYKFKRNWELGLKFRYQGGAPFTPFDENLSRLNYLSQGTGTFDYARLNSLRLGSFNSSDIRIDKKWNLRRATIDLFLDVTNWYASRNPAIPEYTFKRKADNSGFETTDGLPVKADGSNAIPTRVKNDDPFFTPSVGLIVEF